jgi:hypothetical protein
MRISMSLAAVIVSIWAVGGFVAANAQAPGPIVAPSVAPATGSMQSDAVRKALEQDKKAAAPAKSGGDAKSNDKKEPEKK